MNHCSVEEILCRFTPIERKDESIHICRLKIFYSREFYKVGNTAVCCGETVFASADNFSVCGKVPEAGGRRSKTKTNIHSLCIVGRWRGVFKCSKKHESKIKPRLKDTSLASAKVKRICELHLQYYFIREKKGFINARILGSQIHKANGSPPQRATRPCNEKLKIKKNSTFVELYIAISMQ